MALLWLLGPLPALSFEGYPEVESSPHDVSVIFDAFIRLMNQQGVRANA